MTDWGEIEWGKSFVCHQPHVEKCYCFVIVMLFCSILYNLSQMGFHIKVIVTFFSSFPLLHVYLCLYKYKGAINSFFSNSIVDMKRLLYFILDERWTRARIRDGTLIHLSVFLFTTQWLFSQHHKWQSYRKIYSTYCCNFCCAVLHIISPFSFLLYEFILPFKLSLVENTHSTTTVKVFRRIEKKNAFKKIKIHMLTWLLARCVIIIHDDDVEARPGTIFLSEICQSGNKRKT